MQHVQPDIGHPDHTAERIPRNAATRALMKTIPKLHAQSQSQRCVSAWPGSHLLH
jgi:hypothetical protein